jgi:predicted metal-dependent hydrolase
VQSSITWSAAAPRRYARKRTLGSYSVRANTIRISRLLDRRDVPLYFIAYVVYHEMLHADLGISETEGRRAIHTREFRRREKLFRDYARASAWERDTGST